MKWLQHSKELLELALSQGCGNCQMALHWEETGVMLEGDCGIGSRQRQYVPVTLTCLWWSGCCSPGGEGNLAGDVSGVCQRQDWRRGHR